MSADKKVASFVPPRYLFPITYVDNSTKRIWAIMHDRQVVVRSGGGEIIASNLFIVMKMIPFNITEIHSHKTVSIRPRKMDELADLNCPSMIIVCNEA